MYQIKWLFIIIFKNDNNFEYIYIYAKIFISAIQVYFQ